MRMLRSLLYTPGNKPKMLEKAPSAGADGVIFDLEDTIPTDQKVEARKITREYVDRFKGDCVIYARVNGFETGLLPDDLDAVVVDGLNGVTLPKVVSADSVRKVDAMLSELEQSRGLPAGGIAMDIGLETAYGVYIAYDILTASKRIGSLSCGGSQDGDLQNDVRYVWSEEGTETLYIRSKVLLAARAAGIENPMDGVHANFRDEASLVRSAEMARSLGYRGKKAIHPSQVPVINRIFMPTAKELDYYRRVVEAFDASVAKGSAATSVDGKLIDYAMAANARRVLAWAKSFGDR